MSIPKSRFWCDDIVEFSIACRPIACGRKNSNNHSEEAPNRMVKEQFINVVKTYAKMACLEQGFQKKSNGEPIYIFVVVRVGFGALNPRWSKHKEFIRRAKDGKELPVREPNTQRIMGYIQKALKGIAYSKDNQVVASCIIKRYEQVEGIEVLIGAPRNLKELYHDVRNA